MRNGWSRRGIHMPAKFDGRAQPHFAHEQNGCGGRRGRRFGGTGIKTERRHENGVYRFSRGGERGGRIFNSLGLRRQRRGKRADIYRSRGLPKWRGLRRLHARARVFARTGGRIYLQRLNLAAGQAHRAALRNDHALVGKLSLDAHRAARGKHAHFAAFIQAQS